MPDDLLDKTLDLFEPTTEAARTKVPGETKKPRETEIKPKKPRRYEKEHPAFPLRIRPEDKIRIGEQAHELGVSLDTIAAALIHASLDALDEDHLSLTIKKDVVSQQDTLGRSRQRIVTTYTWQWNCQAQGQND